MNWLGFGNEFLVSLEKKTLGWVWQIISSEVHFLVFEGMYAGRSTLNWDFVCHRYWSQGQEWASMLNYLWFGKFSGQLTVNWLSLSLWHRNIHWASPVERLGWALLKGTSVAVMREEQLLPFTLHTQICNFISIWIYYFFHFSGS